MTGDPTPAAPADVIRDALDRFEQGSGDNTVEDARAALASLLAEREALLVRDEEQASKFWAAHAERDEARAERDTANRERDRAKICATELGLERDEFERLCATQKEALEEIQDKQPKMLARLRADGVVFEEQPHYDPENWQQVAFWIYTDLCEAESIARAALRLGEPE